MNLRIGYRIRSRKSMRSRKVHAYKMATKEEMERNVTGVGAYERKKNLRRHRHSSQSEFA